MANRADPTTLALALGERLKTDISPAFQGRLDLFFENGQRASAQFAPAGEDVMISTPVDGAHRGLPKPILMAMLKRNAPDGAIAGGTLRVRPGQGYLEIANALPTALGAQALANILINQANAAAELSAGIRRDVAESLAKAEQEGN